MLGVAHFIDFFSDMPYNTVFDDARLMVELLRLRKVVYRVWLGLLVGKIVFEV